MYKIEKDEDNKQNLSTMHCVVHQTYFEFNDAEIYYVIVLLIPYMYISCRFLKRGFFTLLVMMMVKIGSIIINFLICNRLHGIYFQ